MENATLSELMDKIKTLNNEEINTIIQYCRIIKKANDVKEGKKTVKRKRAKNLSAK